MAAENCSREIRRHSTVIPKEVKVSCSSLEDTASARSRKYILARGCFPHEQMGSEDHR